MCSAADDPSMHDRVTPKPPAVHKVSGQKAEGLTERELLDLYDRTAMYPDLRAAIHAILTGYRR
jgi:hypothetical protein